MTAGIQLQSTIDNIWGTSVAFSADGTHWAIANDGAVHIFENETVSKHIALSGYTSGILAFEQAQNILRAGAYLIDLTTDQSTRYPQDHSVVVQNIDTAHGAESHLFSIINAAWKPDRTRLAILTRYSPERSPDAASYDGPSGQLLLIDPATSSTISVLEDNTGTIDNRAIAASEKWLVAGADEHTTVWDIHTGQVITTLDGEGMLKDLQFNADRTLLAGSRVNGMIDLWRTSTWERIATWKAHKRNAISISFHPQAPLLASGGYDKILAVWDIEKEAPTATQSINTGDRVRAVGFNHRGDKLVASLRLSGAQTNIYTMS